MICIGSLLTHNPQLQVVLHEDGSLEQNGCDALVGLGRTTVLRKRDMDPSVDEKLAKYPACRKFRGQTCIALKLFDAMLFDNSPHFHYVDTDVYFLRPVVDVVDLDFYGVDLLYLRDEKEETYSLRSWDYVRTKGLKLVRELNAGLLAMRRRAFDLDYVEWFLSNSLHHRNKHHGVGEQTTWAAFAGRVSSGYWDPKRLAIGTPSLVPNSQHVAIHWVGMHRHAMPSYVSRRVTADLDRVSVHPSRRCFSWHLLQTELNRFAGRVSSRFSKNSGHN